MSYPLVSMLVHYNHLRRSSAGDYIRFGYTSLQETSEAASDFGSFLAVCSVQTELALGIQYRVLSDHALIPVSTIFGDARLRLIIDIDDPEALAVAISPLEVVHQRPHEVAP